MECWKYKDNWSWNLESISITTGFFFIYCFYRFPNIWELSWVNNLLMYKHLLTLGTISPDLLGICTKLSKQTKFNALTCLESKQNILVCFAWKIYKDTFKKYQLQYSMHQWNASLSEILYGLQRSNVFRKNQTELKKYPSSYYFKKYYERFRKT